ncbi:type II secretion protein E [Pseudomonas protegens]|uniref:Type II secretion protein E n=1 Tax=Pseudomonas protegens TaxID=380021 RepID=A0A2T6GBG8_9PSED|nr:ATPase, T2SS/T4P/T4SS family [Pseudomonas protegens]PUA41487.1 type II secretion protein E [Pseudomonas protegens]
MQTTLVEPDEEIARYVRVTRGDDEMLDIWVADNRRSDFKVQNFVVRVQQANPGRTRLTSLPLHEIAKVKGVLTDEDTGNSVNQNKVLSYFRQAVRLGASDLHLSIGRDNSDFCYVEVRVHGELQMLECIEKDEGFALASTICLSMCDVTEKQFYPNQHQDGRIAERFTRAVGLFGARYAHMPAVGGLYVVMRLIRDDAQAVPSFDELGFLPEQITAIRRMLRRPEGIMLLSGPTGSGKSTTLRTASAFYLAQSSGTGQLPVRRLLTIEDPPEGRIPGAIQTPILADKKNVDELKRAWLLSIAYALRCDPDAILNGEIRDLESAMAAIKAALTGHLMLSTLHANDPLNIIERLEIEGVPGRMIADPQLMIGLISQRLVQRLCSHCKRPYREVAAELDKEDRQLIEARCQVEAVYMRRHEGCCHCHKGIIGRIVVAEVIAPDAQFFELYRTQSKAAAKTYWHRELGGITRNQHVLRYVNAGEVDPLSAHTVCPLDEDCYTLLKES